MGQVDPKYLIALAVAVLLAALFTLGNPEKKYSRKAFWENATLASLAEVPDSALAPGNKNGPVLMWAAMTVDDPAILRALVERGADINEADKLFMGTPLSGAASENPNPDVLNVLVELGADVNARLIENRTPLMTAALYNHNPGIAARLLELGADPDAVDSRGKTALEYAQEAGNEDAIREIQSFSR